MSDDQIEELLENAREEIFNLRFQHASARLEDVMRVRHVRREVAQLKTVLRMRQLAIEEAAQDPDVVKVIDDKEWAAEAYFDYEESMWLVSFVDENDDELAKTRVNLNKKKIRGRRARRKARG
jgi:large subunit ribosomal protein L29